MRALYTSDALDSKKHTIQDKLSNEFEDTVQRLRADTLCRILFGQSIFVPQGWSIDSIPFLKVMNEVETAIRDLKGNTESAADLSPIVAELRAGANNWGLVLGGYLSRTDCIWSGIPILRKSPEHRALLYARFNELNQQKIFDRDLFCQVVEDTLDDTLVARGWHSAFRYFSTNQMQRTKMSASTPGTYQSVVMKMLQSARILNVYGAGPDEAITARLSAFVDQLATLNNRSDRVSTILERAEGELDTASLDVVKSVSSFAQIFAASAENGAMFASPAFSEDVDVADGIADQLARTAYRSMNRGMTSFFARSADNKALSDHYKSLDWRNIWQSVLTLTLTNEWKQHQQDLMATLLAEDAKERLAVVKKMDRLLESEVDNLSLYTSGAAKLSSRLNVRLTKKTSAALSRMADKGIVSAAGAGTAQVGTILLEASLPGATLVGALFAQLVEPVIPETAKRVLNPFNQRGLLSSRYSILTPFRSN